MSSCLSFYPGLRPSVLLRQCDLELFRELLCHDSSVDLLFDGIDVGVGLKLVCRYVMCVYPHSCIVVVVFACHPTRVHSVTDPSPHILESSKTSTALRLGTRVQMRVFRCWLIRL